MNPEFQRNLWLSCGPRRLGLSALLIAVVLLTQVGASDGVRIATYATYLFYLFAVLAGTRDAALCVVGEIRERTWDQQRLSAVGSWSMLWGKLFGATASRWLPALVCLGIVFAITPSLHDAAQLLLIGFAAQVAALLASLIGIRRRAARSRIEAYLYQFVGLAVAVALVSLWPRTATGGTVSWWGWRIDAFWFTVASVLVAVGWGVVGCHRLMRRELLFENAPWVWLGFLGFVVLYAAGWELAANRTAFRAFEAAVALAAVTYVALVLEPQEAVQYRRVAARRRAGAWTQAAALLPAWVYAYAAAVLAWAVLVAVVALTPLPVAGSVGVDRVGTLAAALGFFTRDCALLLWLQLRLRRGADIAGLVVLFVLYWVLPTSALLSALQLKSVSWLFWPMVGDGSGPYAEFASGYAAVIAGWAQAALFGWLAWRTLRRPAATSPAS